MSIRQFLQLYPFHVQLIRLETDMVSVSNSVADEPSICLIRPIADTE